MLRIDVELLHEAVRAAPSTDAALTGVQTDAEWPLSPARLFAAFVAADGSGDRCRVTDGHELLALEAADPPMILADAADRVVQNPLRERFVVLDATKRGTVQEYPARKAALQRPGTRVHPRNTRLTYVYDTFEPEDETLRALQRRAARISYVGCADSPARVRVATTRAPADDERQRWLPGHGTTAMPVPYEGFLAALDHGYAQEQEGGVNRRSWIPTEHLTYGGADDDQLVASGELVVLALDRPVSGHKALHVTETLRSAVLSLAGDDAPALLHGHGMESDGHLQARYLALPFVGHDHADGAVRAAAVWLPPDSQEGDVRRVRAALLGLRELRGGAFGVRTCNPVTSRGGTAPWSADARRWSGLPRGSTRWRSVTPVVHERHGGVDLAEVRRWFAHAGHPEPASFRTMREPFVVGGIRLRPSQLRPRYGQDRFGHFEITFDEPVAGPLVVGRGRQFGLGLFAPAVPAGSDAEAWA